jgi:hypothetical protein
MTGSEQFAAPLLPIFFKNLIEPEQLAGMGPGQVWNGADRRFCPAATRRLVGIFSYHSREARSAPAS